VGSDQVGVVDRVSAGRLPGVAELDRHWGAPYSNVLRLVRCGPILVLCIFAGGVEATSAVVEDIRVNRAVVIIFCGPRYQNATLLRSIQLYNRVNREELFIQFLWNRLSNI